MPIAQAARPGAMLRPGNAIGARFALGHAVPAWIVRVRITQQFVEVLHSGHTNKVRVTQQFAEVLHSGSSNRLRVTQQFVELWHTFGTPPIIGPGNSAKAKQNSSGQQKKADAEQRAMIAHRRRRRIELASRQGRFLAVPAGTLDEFSEYVPQSDPITWREETTRIIRS